MGRSLRVLAWIAAFSAAFAIGAVIAAHSNPFPPGVTDPGAVPSSSAPASPATTKLVGSLHLQSAHYLYVGGSCRTNWKGKVVLEADAGGAVTGTGKVNLVGSLRCDFSVIQVQTKTINVDASGTLKGKRLAITLTPSGIDPKGSSDFGGFAHTLRFIRLSVPVSGTQHVHASRSDGDRGTYTSTGTFAVACRANC